MVSFICQERQSWSTTQVSTPCPRPTATRSPAPESRSEPAKKSTSIVSTPWTLRPGSCRSSLIALVDSMVNSTSLSHLLMPTRCNAAHPPPHACHSHSLRSSLQSSGNSGRPRLFTLTSSAAGRHVTVLSERREANSHADY